MKNASVKSHSTPACSIDVHPLLTAYIKDIQIIRSNSSQLIAPYKVYPSLFIVMGFQYRGRLNVLTDEGKMHLLKSCGITGLLKTYRMFQTATAEIISILFKFYPWTISTLFNISANELTQQSLGLEDILRVKIIDNLQEKIQTAPNPYCASNIIQEFLVNLHLAQNKKIASQQRIVMVAQQLAKHPVIDSIEKLACHYGYSIRSLERHFQEMIGLSPKRFVSTARFQKVLHLLQANIAWEEIAKSFDYYDQAHFIKDFKQFSGITPHQLIHSP
ncbi:helix-turn-helix domain-containing protein [Legionella israelensis]|uniref:helix-turn-helix domain-containing protein n=1 Tax=Legionella israelensis TaxID=454 RepID=UPI00117F81B1|nr:helix-turn-helix domain-containing protein [Legionella israelensis]QDP73152.1 helix-turn-helix domain-containing protein [Legionella israelensis]